MTYKFTQLPVTGLMLGLVALSIGGARDVVALTPPQTPNPIQDGRYWMGHTGQGLEVQGDRYRYDDEGGSKPWRSRSELTAVKHGVLFDGNSHWCLASLKPRDQVASCSAQGWITYQSTVVEPSPTAEFGFYLRDDLGKLMQEGNSDRVLQQDSRIVNVMRTACGPGATAKVSTMPKFTSRETLIPEKVVEVDARNRTIRRWAKPLNSRVLAISGDRILVETGQNQSYWIGADGRLELQTEPQALTAPTRVPYKKHPEFPPTGIYSQRFVDMNSGRDRQIIADAPCT